MLYQQKYIDLHCISIHILLFSSSGIFIQSKSKITEHNDTGNSFYFIEYEISLIFLNHRIINTSCFKWHFIEIRKYFSKYIELKENGHACNEGILDKLKIRRYLHDLCHDKDNIRKAFEQFCMKDKKGKYKCSKSWKCKNVGCMGCIKHECIVAGNTQEITKKDILKTKENGIFLKSFWVLFFPRI